MKRDENWPQRTHTAMAIMPNAITTISDSFSDGQEMMIVQSSKYTQVVVWCQGPVFGPLLPPLRSSENGCTATHKRV